MEKNKHKNDTTIENVVRNTISMCITGCLAGRYNDAENSRIASEFTIGSVRTYLENYTNDYTVDFFLDNFNQLMRNIFSHTLPADADEDSQIEAVHKIAERMSKFLDTNWKHLMKDVFPTGTVIDFDSIKLLDKIQYTEQEIVRYLNHDLLNSEHPNVTKEDTIYEDDNVKIMGPIDMGDLPEDMPDSIRELLMSVTNGGIEPTTDDEIKEVGDSVHIPDAINTAYLINEDGEQTWKRGENPRTNDNAHLVHKKAVVILKNQDMIYKCNNCDHDHDADLMIYYAHNDTKYYINSDFVKILSNTKV